MQTQAMQYFPIFFILVWLGVTTLLGLLSGWFSLMQMYPNQDEVTLLTLRAQSGSMGFGVNMQGVLRLSACPSGLRVGIFRIFGIFNKDFFVPWDAISVVRRKSFFLPVAELNFGSPSKGRLVIPAHVANRLAHAAPNRWPEREPSPIETRKTTFENVFRTWLLMTAAASTFLIVAPRIMAPTKAAPPILVAILFPAIVFGIKSVVRYFIQSKKLD